MFRCYNANYVLKFSFSEIFTDVFLDEMMKYLRSASNALGRWGRAWGLEETQWP